MIKQSSNDTPRLTFTFNPVLEFITAMYRVANLELFDRVYVEYRVQQDPEVLNWLRQMHERLSPFMRRELSFFFGVEHSHADQAFHQGAFYGACGNLNDGISKLKRIHPLQIIQFLIEDITDDDTRNELIELFYQDLTADVTPTPDELRMRVPTDTVATARVFEALSDINETKGRFVALVHSFYEHAYSELEPLIMTLGFSAVSRFEERYSLSPSEFFTDFFATDPTVYDKDTQVHISGLTQFGCFASLTRGHMIPHFVRLGLRTEELVGSDLENEQLEKFCKVISDKNRLEIIRLLSVRPWYGQELAKKLQLSPAAISYHMGFFYASDLVTLKRADQRGYFELDRQRLSFLFSLLEKALNLP